MYSTAEVRWFYQGAILPAVAAWFRGLEHAPVEELPRVDHYLRHAGGDSLGIKLRDGRLEVKLRHTERGIVRLHPRVAGRVELWRKWSFALIESASQGLHREIVGPLWTAVEKQRSVRLYRLEEESVVAAAPAELPDQGCDLELTRVSVGAVDWWTLGLEAYGAEPVLENGLLLVMEYLLARAEPPPLTAENSYGYPRWSLQLEQDPDRRPGSARGPGH